MRQRMITTSALSIFVFILTVMPVYCQDAGNKTQEQKPEIKTIPCIVAQVEFVEAFIMVTGENGYMTVSVPDKTPVSRQGKTIGFDEINPGDSIILQYYSPEPGKYVAVSIQDSTAA